MPRRQLDFREFDSIIKDIETLRQQGYTKVGKWDLSQVCRHLSIAMQMSIRDQKVQSAPWLVRKLVAPIIRRRIFKTRKIPEGIKVPDSVLPGDKEIFCRAMRVSAFDGTNFSK